MDREEIVKNYEEMLNKIKDIISTKIVVDDSGQIEEIHVLAEPHRDPKYLVRDIESTLIAAYGSKIDHRKISVAQQVYNDSFYKGSRLIFDRLGLTISGNILEVNISLEDEDGNKCTGSSKGIITNRNRLRLIGIAVLDAIEQHLGNPNIFTIEEVIISNIAGHEAVMIGVSMIRDFEEEILVGSAIVKKDINETVVRATLDAINRKIVIR
ncbi:MAG TPA: hypothetical protein GX526_00895 [Thermoanaerobacterales bacterium]|nr:hypothetical protein [Thermoanaerobacterales bacterium]